MGRTKGSKNKNKKSKLESLPLFSAIERDNGEGISYVRGLLRVPDNEDWRGINAVPPDSPLYDIVDVFKTYTDIPLEIPVFVFFHFLSAYLLKNNVKIILNDQNIDPDTWTVILANSGSGKSFATNLIEETCSLKIDSSMGDIASSAKFVEELKAKNRSLWIKDEFAQFLKHIQQLGHMTEMKDYLLKVYDGKVIERITKKETIIINNPALTLLGLTVKDSFIKNISADDMINGFAQRFSYIIAYEDKSRPMVNYPVYDYKTIYNVLKNVWDRIANVHVNSTYLVSQESFDYFKNTFSYLYNENQDVDKSFYRRCLWRTIKYAAMYHLLLEKTNDIIDRGDMIWASRAISLFLKDTKSLLNSYGLSDFAKIVYSAESLKRKLEGEGKKLTPRDLITHISAIKNANEAKSILSLM